MTAIETLRVFMEDALLDLPREDYKPEWDALAKLETLLQAAERALLGMTELKSLPGVVGMISTDDIAALAAAVRDVKGETT